MLPSQAHIQVNQQLVLTADAQGLFVLDGRQFPSIDALVEHFMGSGEALDIGGRCEIAAMLLTLQEVLSKPARRRRHPCRVDQP